MISLLLAILIFFLILPILEKFINAAVGKVAVY